MYINITLYSKVKMNLIVARCVNNGIGFEGKIPWRVDSDLHYFSKITKGEGLNAVIMGKNTWDSLPLIKGEKRGLMSRHNLVLSTSTSFDNENNYSEKIKIFKGIEEIVAYLDTNPSLFEDIWVIGGEQIYKQFLDLNIISRCYVTIINKFFNCDTFFPLLLSNEWKEIERTNTYCFSNECEVSYVVYEKEER